MTLNHAQGALEPDQANLESRQAGAILQRGHVDECLLPFPQARLNAGSQLPF